MTILTMEQGSDEWRQARCGKVSGSRISDIIATIKSGEAAARRDYRFELVCERLTKVPAEPGFVSKEMIWGLEQEARARAAYEVMTGLIVDQVGLVTHPTIMNAVSSPDGLIPTCNGGIEIKAPKTSTHLLTLESGTIPAQHLPQMAWLQSTAGLDWVDFISYDPRLPKNLQLFVKRYERDQSYIDHLEAEVCKFLAEVDSMELKWRGRPTGDLKVGR